MVHDNSPCPRSTQLEILKWRIQASRHHVDFFYSETIQRHFYPQNIVLSLTDLDQIFRSETDFYFLWNCRLFLYQDAKIIEFDPSLLFVQFLDESWIMHLYMYVFFSDFISGESKQYLEFLLPKGFPIVKGEEFKSLLEFKSKCFEKKEEKEKLSFFIQSVVKDIIPRNEECDYCSIVNDLQCFHDINDDWIELYKSGRIESCDVKISDFFQLQKWDSWLSFRVQNPSLGLNRLIPI